VCFFKSFGRKETGVAIQMSEFVP